MCAVGGSVVTSGRCKKHDDGAIGNEFGGAGGIRTRDPLLAKQVLSQLSYSPVKHLRRCGIGDVQQRGEKSRIQDMVPTL